MVKKLWMNINQYINWLKEQQTFKEIKNGEKNE